MLFYFLDKFKVQNELYSPHAVSYVDGKKKKQTKFKKIEFFLCFKILKFFKSKLMFEKVRCSIKTRSK